MNVISKGRYKYIQYKVGNAKAIFITADGPDFNLKNTEYVQAFKEIRDIFNLDDIAYSIQIHSDIIHIYDGNIYEGDAIITNKLSTAAGIFTADCVPILMYDTKNKICAAVHSGWKGTYSKIVMKTVEKMKKVYGSKSEDINVFIGPHIRSCCYEVGKDLIDKFCNDDIYKGYNISSKNMLNLEKCIRIQCIKSGILEEKIESTNLCTFCSSEIKLHSYRRNNEKSGRLFSFIYAV
ncbi:peptidoglycan editing factor PgeF [Clostridium sp. 19966]|uniref:peptidoglycan editing factor PgeF n=1 Tax=Clostridium sp. 19966 TaxID=2768166 RepID=UPI0028DF17D0|nr:peptidoglycan editing factor PgeF [Clostridium sp. 19966]MDT8718143.1 peptidoglycan editing factor PgeF [Clostridium sp. 19966]